MGVRWSFRRAVGVTAAALVALLVAAATAGAQLLPLPGFSTTTTAPPRPTTTAAPATTTTTARGLLAPPPTQPPPTTTVPTPAPAGPSAGQPPVVLAPEPATSGGGDGEAPVGAGGFPPELQRLMQSVPRSRANNTRALLAALAPLEAYGLDATQRAVVGFGRFPVAGETSWSHDWWFPRFGPGWRLHEGIDLFAPHGTPVRAPVDGVVRVSQGGLGGLAVYVVQPDATYWYLAHLAGLAEGIATGATVRTGQVLGYVGDSGNARGGAPHLHFEIHPRGGPPIDPKAVVDRFVAEAFGLVPALLDAYAKARPAASAPPAPVAPVAPAPVLPSLSPRAALLWAATLNPVAGGVRLAELEALAAAGSVRLDSATARAADERAEVALRTRLHLLALVPYRLQGAL